MVDWKNFREDSVSVPTSETLFCDVWSKTVQSYRDLPKGVESVVFRSPCKERDSKTIPSFPEFLWQEGHTIHATYEEAEERTKQMWKSARDFAQDVLTNPSSFGRKTEK